MGKKSCEDKARAFVNSYTTIGTGIVVAAIVPGSTSTALILIEGHMCYEIGKIYLGDNYSLRDATGAAAAIGISAVAGQVVALEAMNWLPGPGWLVKGVTAAGVIKALGEVVIVHYESVSDNKAA